MKKLIFPFFSILILLCCFFHSSSSESPLPDVTAAPRIIDILVYDPPEAIHQMISVAEKEWTKVNGKPLPKSNKYTRWMNNSEWGWCAGFTSWCAVKAGIPHASLNEILDMEEDQLESVFTCTSVNPAKQLRAYQHMNRTTMIPQKGFLVLYGEKKNITVHIGLITDVKLIDYGRYRITTIEGNMRNTIRKYTFDYITEYPNESDQSTGNMIPVPPELRNTEESIQQSWHLRVSDSDNSEWYVTCFLMTWIPNEDFIVTEEELFP